MNEVSPTTQAIVEGKPPLHVHIDHLHVLRQTDGEVKIQQTEHSSNHRSIARNRIRVMFLL